MRAHRFGSILLAGITALFLATSAAGQAKGPVERFSATGINISNNNEPVNIDLIRWSTDEERDKLVSVLAWYGEREMPGSLPTVGYVWTSESAGYSVRYAYRIQAPDGGQRIILMTDRPLGGSPQSWKPVGAAANAAAYPFTVIELRLNKAGQGDGKTSITHKLTIDAAAKTIALENYAAPPVLLSKVSRTNR